MIINRLIDLEKALVSKGHLHSVPGFEEIPFGFVIVLDEQANFEVHNLNGKAEFAPITIRRGTQKLGGFLYDRPDYLLGVPDSKEVKKAKTEEAKQKAQAKADKDAAERLDAFRARLKDIRQRVEREGQHYPVLDIIDRFYNEKLPAFLNDIRAKPILAAADKTPWVALAVRTEGGQGWALAFQIEGLRDHLVQSLYEEAFGVGQCLITGRTGPLIRLHGAVKGVLGAQGAGVALVSFNDPSFRSYGFDGNLNAPMLNEVANGYHRALNWMLDSRDHHVRIGTGKVVGDGSLLLWSETDASLLKIIDGTAPEEELEKLAGAVDQRYADLEESENSEASHHERMLALQAAALSSSAPEPVEGRFFALGLKSNSGRLAVNFWHEQYAHEAYVHAVQWFEDMALVPPPTKGDPVSPYISIFDFLRALQGNLNGKVFDKKSADRWARIKNSLFQSAITGEPLDPVILDSVLYALKNTSLAVLSDLTIRNKSDFGFRLIQHRLVSLAKLTLTRYPMPEVRQEMETVSMDLNPGSTNVPYTLGRLFAAFEKTQQLAVGRVKSSILNRVSGSVETPAFEFASLMAKNAKHLASINGGRGGLRGWMEKQIMEIVRQLPPEAELPRFLTPEQQCMFFIGYWQQRDAFAFKKTAEPEPESSVEDGDDDIAA